MRGSSSCRLLKCLPQPPRARKRFDMKLMGGRFLCDRIDRRRFPKARIYRVLSLVLCLLSRGLKVRNPSGTATLHKGLW